jgi:hypothetical protein
MLACLPQPGEIVLRQAVGQMYDALTLGAAFMALSLAADTLFCTKIIEVPQLRSGDHSLQLAYSTSIRRSLCTLPVAVAWL